MTLINTNMMKPPIGPLGLDYIAGASKKCGINTETLDLCLEKSYEQALKKYFSQKEPSLVGLSFRNVDDCFWPSAEWFVPQLGWIIDVIRQLSDAPIVVGGVSFSIFGKDIVESTGADFGIVGDGEQAIAALYNELRGSKKFEAIKGLIWRRDGQILTNGKAWPEPLSLAVSRDAVDNPAYFKQGGQCGIETKRGCDGRCLYCADPLAKGTKVRVREPAEVADEVQVLLNQGINVLHICDSEFNIPYNHALAVCEEFIRRRLGDKVRWYTYMAIQPFNTELASAMKKAGCAGIDFTTDSACALMLKTYRHDYFKQDIEAAVRLCKENGITVMLDLLLGGPGETPQTVEETIDFIKRIRPDCVGAALGVRIYPGTGMESVIAAEGEPEANPNIKRKYGGAINFFKPTFYIAGSLGERPAELVRDLIGADKRFFEPMPEAGKEIEPTDHNYNANIELVDAIKKGAKGAYWDILRRLRS